MLKNTCLFLLIVSFANITLGQSSSTSGTAIDQKSRLQWFRDAKFGMFIHWGVYSQAGGEWNGETNHHEWLQLTAKIPLAEYTEFAKSFNPTKFDADEWVKTAKDAGMEYLVITSKHHDGFAIYDSASSGHDIADVSKFDRDPLKELADACQKHGIRFCVYYSLGRDWEDPDVATGRGDKVGFRSNLIDFPNESEKVFERYFERKVKPQIRELLTGYGPIGILWFDTYELISKEQSVELKALIRELQPECIINERIGHNLGDYKVSEQTIPEDGSYDPWESCITMNGHWAYNKADSNWKSPKSMIESLVDIVSKGGNLLLNVGPTGEGVIPPPSVERLSLIGDWMDVNGEAIKGCDPTPFGEELGRKEKDKNGKQKVVGKLPWRATTKGDKIYIHLFEWPTGELVLPTIDKKIQNAYFLGHPSDSLNVKQSDGRSTITMPASPVKSLVPVICLELAR
ncbi:Alpha-L-fucosidase [Novipirellula aureliae]|uniref:alpha-L-fucosidase n=1 Tax=Novipirellula aureliae TaxID=2527966 RepID=A0A5C6E640_9BACT|nr:alpha-L-fucosidase [Novipirellula aureliae]TWU44288.1 Alpha-L-fucosidase [Novipirellula aureliae]